MATLQGTGVSDVNSIIEDNAERELSGEEGFDKKYPNRPRNHSKTLPFHDLFLTLFNPLNENRKKRTGPTIARTKVGPHGPSYHSPHETRQLIIERFISRWRKEVGDDIFPAFRLILPEKDRDRAMYGLKEKTIGKLLIKVMKINKDSEDGYDLLNWKQPAQSTTSRMAGDFAGRCFEVVSKRPMRTAVGNLSVGEINKLLGKLAAAQKEETQLPIFEKLYKNMNADELMWIIRIILRQMKVGATEKTFFHIWHPDAESLFNVSSNLRRVCWELHDPSLRLDGDNRDIKLMQCFQPQLAQFQMHTIQKMVDRMRPTEEDPVFWIEEKLDGERMQLHMISDDNTPGGKKFGFWSRKAKDYTYLYGDSFFDEQGAMTRHIKDAFREGVENIILDGEMITWDPEQDAMVPFGTLKTAAINLSKDMNSAGHRPLYRIFDVLYLNGQALTNYTLRDRRRALEMSVKAVHRRMEIHTYVEAKSFLEVDPLLRKVVQEASEGLVLKNPRSPYRLNERNDDWMKVKPEYMTEYGESLDCIVVGGYYGSGHRGGNLSSFLCGLRVDKNEIQKGANPMKCISFFKVGGGFTLADYAEIRHRTDGKWKEWNSKRPPSEFVELAGSGLQYERPDVWIKPSDSIVLSVKAASVSVTDQFKLGLTLRFPRFKKLRTDRDWTTALSVNGFLALQKNVEKERNDKQFKIDDGRKKRQKKTSKKAMTIVGNSDILNTPYGVPETDVFQGLNFYVMSESQVPEKMSKAELEQLIKNNGGKIFQNHDANPNIICIGDRRVVKVASLIKRGNVDIVRPSWIFACVKQSECDTGRERMLLPQEPKDMLFTTDKSRVMIENAVDNYGDSYARDITGEELKGIFESMSETQDLGVGASSFQTQLYQDDPQLRLLPGSIFKGLLLYMNKSNNPNSNGVSSSVPPKALDVDELRTTLAQNIALFSAAKFTENLADENITHIIIRGTKAEKSLREAISCRKRLPRIVTIDWIEQSFAEKTLLDEERFATF